MLCQATAAAAVCKAVLLLQCSTACCEFADTPWHDLVADNMLLLLLTW
jgi:hypothetical protein